MSLLDKFHTMVFKRELYLLRYVYCLDWHKQCLISWDTLWWFLALDAVLLKAECAKQLLLLLWCFCSSVPRGIRPNNNNSAPSIHSPLSAQLSTHCVTCPTQAKQHKLVLLIFIISIIIYHLHSFYWPHSALPNTSQWSLYLTIVLLLVVQRLKTPCKSCGSA